MCALSNRVTVRQSVRSYIRSQPRYLLQVGTHCQNSHYLIVSNLQMPGALKNNIQNNKKSILNKKSIMSKKNC